MIAVEFDRDVVVMVHAVFELDAFEAFRRHRTRIEVGARRDGRVLDEAVLHRLTKIVAINDVLELLGFCANRLRSCSQLQT